MERVRGVGWVFYTPPFVPCLGFGSSKYPVEVAGWGRNRSKFAIHGSVAPFAGIRARKFLI